MMNESSKDCARLRREYDAQPQSDAFSAHAASCAGCRAWRADMVAIAESASMMPQFDVPEQLTQSILGSIATQPSPGTTLHQALAFPVGLGCLAVSVSLLPFDTAEGLASTALCIVALSLVYLFIRSGGDSEDVVTT